MGVEDNVPTDGGFCKKIPANLLLHVALVIYIKISALGGNLPLLHES